MQKKKEVKVVVALSGGVDSSVAAALLKRAGFNVQGVYMRLWKAKDASRADLGRTRRGLPSTIAEERAKKVAKTLNIPFKVIDLKQEFKKRVLDYFVEEYRQGRTPNPCVVCNKEIKFGLLLDWAMKNGADYLATGHYVRKFKIQNSKFKITSKNLKSPEFKLLRAKDKNKDQSYFLWRLGQKQLSRLLFPIGEIVSKAEVRRLAEEFGLPTAKTEESNDVCFLQDTDFYKFLQSRIKANKGIIVDVNGSILGEHQGLWRYTIGQRKGLGLSVFALRKSLDYGEAKAGFPWFVVEKDMEKNTLVVSQSEKDLLKKELIAEKVNFISGQEVKLPLKVKAKIRYRAESATAIISKKISKGKYKVNFAKPQRAITSGQSVVFYQGEELIGGSVIV